jgi:hypothetical protein
MKSKDLSALTCHHADPIIINDGTLRAGYCADAGRYLEVGISGAERFL